MSWGRREFKDAYSRAEQKSAQRREAIEDEIANYWDIWAEMQHQFDDDWVPSVREIATGRLLTMLVKLRVRYAKDLLDRWHW